MHKFTIVILGLPVGILIFAGILPSILNNDWQWFERSGSLVTAYGIFLAYLDFSGIFKIIVEVLIEKADMLFPNLETDNKDDTKIDSPTTDDFNEALIDAQKKMTDWMRAKEFILIFIGTIIWGYGGTIQILIDK